MDENDLTEERKIDALKCLCLCCGCTWFRRTENPRKCPRCQSAYWNKGRPELKYDFGSIEVGETKVYKMFWDEGRDAPDERRNLNMYSALKSYEHRHPGTVFYTEHKGMKMYVYRKA